MKKLIYALLIAMTLWSCEKQKDEITLTIKGDTGTFYVVYSINGKEYKNSVNSGWEYSFQPNSGDQIKITGQSNANASEFHTYILLNKNGVDSCYAPKGSFCSSTYTYN